MVEKAPYIKSIKIKIIKICTKTPKIFRKL